MKKVLLVSSSGGHYAQLEFVYNFFKDKKIFVITEKTRTNTNKDAKYIFQLKLKNILFPFKYFINKKKIINYINEIKPEIIISFGSLSTIPAIFYGKKKKIKTVFIESFSNQKVLTKTGNILYEKVDIFIVQSKALLEKYSKSIYIGELY